MAETSWTVPLGEGIDALVDWLSDHLSWLTRDASSAIGGTIDGAANLLTWFHPVVILVVFAAVSFALTRRWMLTIGAPLGLGFIWNLGLWEPTMETLALVLFSTAVAIVVGLPVGISAAVFKRFRAVVLPVLDFMQTLPAFVYLLPAIPFFGIGSTSAMISTIIFAMPPAIRLTILGIEQVPEDLVEAANAFGSTTLQKLVKLQIPLALPTIRAGINQTVLLSLSMVVIAAMIGAGGLGAEVLRALNRNEIGNGFEAGLGIVILAITLDRILQSAGRSKADAD